MNVQSKVRRVAVCEEQASNTHYDADEEPVVEMPQLRHVCTWILILKIANK